MVRPVESSPHNSLHDEVIGSGCRSYAHAEVNLPVGRDIQIDRRKKLLLLIVESE